MTCRGSSKRTPDARGGRRGLPWSPTAGPGCARALLPWRPAAVVRGDSVAGWRVVGQCGTFVLLYPHLSLEPYHAPMGVRASLCSPQIAAVPEGAVQEGVCIFSSACESPGCPQTVPNKSPVLLGLGRPRLSTSPGSPAFWRVTMEATTCALPPPPLSAKCAVRGGLLLQSALSARVCECVCYKQGRKSHLMHT